MHEVIIAEFAEDFLKKYRQLCAGAPIELLTAPKIFLHDPNYPCTDVSLNLDAQLHTPRKARVKDVGNLYNAKVLETQLTVSLDVDGFDYKAMRFIPYAILFSDPYQNRSSRRYSRSVISALLELPNGFSIVPFVAPADMADKLQKTYQAIPDGPME